MAKDCEEARVYDLAAFRARGTSRCAICGSRVAPGARWTDLDGREWDVCRPCGDEATRTAAR